MLKNIMVMRNDVVAQNDRFITIYRCSNNGKGIITESAILTLEADSMGIPVVYSDLDWVSDRYTDFRQISKKFGEKTTKMILQQLDQDLTVEFCILKTSHGEIFRILKYLPEKSKYYIVF